jgi:hypothetical protein
MRFPFILLVFYLLTPFHSAGQDSLHIKVHFLYGSKPKKEFKDSERKWFGGKLGGHVGIEYEPDQIVDFVRSGEFHWFAKKNKRHSRFALRSSSAFWGIFRYPADSVKKASVIIPIARKDKITLDSLIKTYSAQTPYDYAFFGMRCGSATYDILSQLGIFKPYSVPKTSRKIFYPKKLRKRLFAKAEIHQWRIVNEPGTNRRKWERD